MSHKFGCQSDFIDLDFTFEKWAKLADLLLEIILAPGVNITRKSLANVSTQLERKYTLTLKTQRKIPIKIQRNSGGVFL